MNNQVEGLTNLTQLHNAIGLAEEKYHLNQIKKENTMNAAIRNAEIEKNGVATPEVDLTSQRAQDLAAQYNLMDKNSINGLLTPYMGGFVKNVLKYKTKEELVNQLVAFKLQDFAPKASPSSANKKGNSLRGVFFEKFKANEQVKKSEIVSWLKENTEISEEKELNKRVSWLINDFKWYNKDKTITKEKLDDGDILYTGADKEL